jgi:hypothetical protein
MVMVFPGLDWVDLVDFAMSALSSAMLADNCQSITW